METVPASAEASIATTSAASGAPALRRGHLGLLNAVVISVAVMSPAASIFFNTIPQAGAAGAAVPFCYLVGFVVALIVANQYSELSRELPSSGSAYTFVVEGLGPRWGFLTGWIGLIAIALGVPYSFVLMSATLETLVARWTGFDLHWSAYYVAAVGIVFALCYIGIRQSLRVDLTLLLFEIGICLVLAGIVLVTIYNRGGLPAAPFSPASAPRPDPLSFAGNLTVGIAFAVLSFIGFETAAALGEETRHPHRNIPRAVYGSMLVVGVFYVLMAYVATVGYGPDKMVTGYYNDLAPFDTIAHSFGGDTLAVLVDVAGLLSFFAAALAIVNGGARILYTVGRDGLLPRWLGRAHATRHTPVAAVAALCTLGLVGGLALGFGLGPRNAFGFLGLLDALFVLLIYILVSVACLRFFRRRRRAQFNLLRHGILPMAGLFITGILTLLVLAAALTSNTPGTGAYVAIPAVVGVWLLLGIVGSRLVRIVPDEVPAAGAAVQDA
jgi:amino acid transporter